MPMPMRELSPAEHGTFAKRWKNARTSFFNRTKALEDVQSDIELDINLLALTGVEDMLQAANTRGILKKLRNAGSGA